MRIEDMSEDEQHAISLLSPQERAAMGEAITDDPKDQVIEVSEADLAAGIESKAKNGIDDDDQAAAKKPAAGDDDDDEEGDDDEDEDDDGAAAAAEAEKAAAEAAQNQANPDAGAVEEIPLDLTPVDAQYKATIAQLDAEKAEKFKALMEGDIDAAEYAAAESKYMNDREAARDQREEHAAWFRDVNEFKNRMLKEDGINYQTDTKLMQSWDRWVKTLADDPENAKKDGMWFLEEAHKMVKIQHADLVKPNSGAKATNAAKEPPKVTVKKSRVPNLADIPPTLGGLPAASEMENGDEGEFAHIEKLSGMEFERALARMSPEQKDRYERMS